MKDKIFIGIKLFLVAGISGLLLFFVNDFTEDKILENNVSKEESKYILIFPESESYEKVIINAGISTKIVAKNNDGQIIGTIYSANLLNDYGNISVLIGINLENEIVGIEYVELNQTPTYAVKVKEQQFLDKFIGNDTNTNYDDFDTRIGATYSATTVKDLVDLISKYHQEVNNE